VKRAKQIIGIFLILFAIAALVYWETGGRDQVVTIKVLAAGQNISQGEIITPQMLRIVRAMPETVIEGAFSAADANKALGKVAACEIALNQQISELLLEEPDKKEVKKLSPFLIKSEWIDSRSSSLRSGDIVAIYNRDGGFYLGSFEIMSVQDSADREITEGGIVDHFEILTEVEQYQKIIKYIDSSGEKFLIVQRSDK